MSLMSELEDLGELMADNLVTMGVTDATASDGLTTLANKVLDIQGGGTCISVELRSDKSILSQTHSESANLTAIVKENGTVKSGATVEFFNGSTSLGTSTTDSDGIATKTYNSTGVGDVSITAQSGGASSSPYIIEDCQYNSNTEKTYGGTNNNQLYDSNLSIALANKQEISFDAKIGTTSASKDYRYWLLPKSLLSGMTYPSCAIYFDKKPTQIWLGKIENGTSTAIGYFNTASNSYVRFKYVIEGTTVKLYADDVLLNTLSVSCMQNYSDWSISLMTWSGSETRYIKNVKAKPL